MIIMINSNDVILSFGHIIKKWAHGDLNTGSSPCKGDVITELDYEPTETYLVEIHLNFETW